MIKPFISREVKQIKQMIKDQWGAEPELHYHFLKSAKGRIHIVTKDIEHIDFRQLRVDTMGLYFGELRKDQLRLSIEGSQLIGPTATKNVVDITKDEVVLWLTGNNLEKEGPWENFVIVKHQDDFFGTGRYHEGIITNFVPKSRRLQVVH